jgi:hypothetical protein
VGGEVKVPGRHGPGRWVAPAGVPGAEEPP